MILLDKSPENILQEELQRERAEVLYRAGEQVSEILEQLQGLENEIVSLLVPFSERQADGVNREDCFPTVRKPQAMIETVNEKICQFNLLREDAKLRYHYLIITREALGMRRHHWVEAIYKIPERKGPLYDR
jgi:hypothetical protein